MPSLAFCCGVLFMLAGAGLAVFERRVGRRLLELRTDPAADSRSAEYLQSRSRRRLKIGLWILLLGMTVVAGESVEVRVHPIIYVSCWCAAALISVALVRLAVHDYIALRRHWGGELLRSENDLERTRSELRRHRSPEAEPPGP